MGSPGAGDLAFVLALGNIVALVAARRRRRRRGCRTSLAWLEWSNREGKGRERVLRTHHGCCEVAVACCWDGASLSSWFVVIDVAVGLAWMACECVVG